MSVRILDDGTLDTVVGYTTKNMDGNSGEELTFRFSQDFRADFETTNEFLEAAKEDIEEALFQQEDDYERGE